MRAAVVGVIEHKHIAAAHRACVFANDGFDAFTHAAQVHRHVGRIGNEVPLSTEQGTRKIEALFDVHRVSGVLQLQTHLLCNVHEEVVEHFEQHRIDRGTRSMFGLTHFHAFQQQMV